MEEIEADVDPIQRIGHAERAAVTKAEVAIPLRVETNRKKQGDDRAERDNCQL